MKRANAIASAILLAATCVFAQQQNTTVQQTTIQQTTVQQTTIKQDSISEIDKTTAEQSSNNARTAGLGIRAGSVTAGIGIRGDFNFANYWGTEELNGADGEASGWGFNFGITARFEIIDVLWFTPELHFEYLKLAQDYDEINVDLKQSNLVLPLMIRAVLHPRVYFEVGPQLSLNLSNDFEYDADRSEIHVPGAPDIVVDKPKDFDDNIEQATFAFGVAMGLGFYIIPDRLSINARIHIGLTDLYPDATSVILYEGEGSNKVDPDKCKIMVGTKLRTIKLGASFWFI